MVLDAGWQCGDPSEGQSFDPEDCMAFDPHAQVLQFMDPPLTMKHRLMLPFGYQVHDACQGNVTTGY